MPSCDSDTAINQLRPKPPAHPAAVHLGVLRKGGSVLNWTLASSGQRGRDRTRPARRVAGPGREQRIAVPAFLLVTVQTQSLQGPELRQWRGEIAGSARASPKAARRRRRDTRPSPMHERLWVQLARRRRRTARAAGRGRLASHSRTEIDDALDGSTCRRQAKDTAAFSQHTEAGCGVVGATSARRQTGSMRRRSVAWHTRVRDAAKPYARGLKLTERAASGQSRRGFRREGRMTCAHSCVRRRIAPTQTKIGPTGPM